MIIRTDALATRNLIIDGGHRALIEFLDTTGGASPGQKRRAYGKEIIQGLYRLTAGVIAEVIAAFVEQWIAGHLFDEDMALARFIQRNQKTRKVA